MRTLYPYIRICLRDRAHSNPLIHLLGLSFCLVLGGVLLEQPAKAMVVESKSDFSEFAIAPTEAQEPKTLVTIPFVKANEPLTKHTETVLASVLEESIASKHTETALTSVLEESPASNSPAERLPTLGMSPAGVTKTLPTKTVDSTVELGLAGTLGLRGNRLTPRSEVAYEPVAIELEELPNAIAQIDAPPIVDEADEADRADETDEADGADEADEAVDTVGSETELPAVTEPLADYQPLLEFQAVSIYQEDDFSGRLRTTGIYALNEQVLFGAVVDLTTGDAFVDSDDGGLSLNELYVSAAPIRDLPNLRVVGGLIDFTSYFDRNSFAKDAATHFFNPVFQTNPALSAAGIASRPGLLVNWSATDHLELKAAAFSSTRDLGDFAIDGFAAEVGFRIENLIIRGTYATARDAGEDNGFAEIFQFERDNGRFGLLDDDREVAYGINAEYFFESINLGIFGRYGWYENQDLDSEGTTFSLGLTALDVFLDGDRLGLAYGQRLSNSNLQSGKTPDVWELLYDAPIFTGVRAGISLQSQDEFSDTFLGLRIRADW